MIAAFQPISLLCIYDGSSRNIQISLVVDGWQCSRLVVGSTSRLPFPASILGL
ncbi:hypothetical protein [Limnospira platensis]|uniref:hypothetical protein n=1 Tax=Limnospira platensis TaxID=118562 RepID=UPI00190FB29E|nr:hypothetical protein AP9108_34850 [Arthrospira sp. PCC 9108]WAK74440.1 hypothetical protein AP9108_33910 [Arthrospira sp. PCC 9108]